MLDFIVKGEEDFLQVCFNVDVDIKFVNYLMSVNSLSIVYVGFYLMSFICQNL